MGGPLLIRFGTFVIEPTRTARSEHSISRSQFTGATLKVLYTLRDAGFEAYVVGGGVRDLLAGLEPKDFDVATNAHPEEIRKLFRSCRLVGRRFVIAHVRFGDEIIEVTTFRGPITDMHERDETGRILSDNAYGTLETDAFRRDFTINALYYDIRDFGIVDFAGGMDDMQARVLRLIGDPELRYREDPVRMLRAIRIGNKLHFQLDGGAVEPIRRLTALLREIPPARLFDEVLKLLLCNDAVENFRALHWLGLWGELFPDVEAEMHRNHDATRRVIETSLASTEDRLKQGLTVSPAFIFAALLWPAVKARMEALQTEQGHVAAVALAQAAEEIVGRQIQRVAIPKRFSIPAKEIWSLQLRFDVRRGGRPKRLMAHPVFRAAYDFLLLRAKTGEPVQELADWWTAAQKGEASQVPDDQQMPEVPGPKRRRRRRRGGNRGSPAPAQA